MRFGDSEEHNQAHLSRVKMVQNVTFGIQSTEQKIGNDVEKERNEKERGRRKERREIETK